MLESVEIVSGCRVLKGWGVHHGGTYMYNVHVCNNKDKYRPHAKASNNYLRNQMFYFHGLRYSLTQLVYLLRGCDWLLFDLCTQLVGGYTCLFPVSSSSVLQSSLSLRAAAGPPLSSRGGDKKVPWLQL